MSPQRIERTEDWKPSKGAVWVGPRSKFNNPYGVPQGWATSSRQNIVDDFKRWLTIETTIRQGKEVFFNGCDGHLGVKYSDRNQILDALESLRGKDLVCRCPISQPCHADVLLEMANQ